MILYEYKKNYEKKFPCCQKGNMTLCIKIVLLLIGWLIILSLGIVTLLDYARLLKEYISKLAKFLKTNPALCKIILKMINKFL